MKQHSRYAIMGLNALKRAAEKVAEDARKNNYKIPVWKNGRIIHETPEMTTDQKKSSDTKRMSSESGA